MRMLEKDMENLIAKNPDEFFPNSGFKLIGQQKSLHKRVVDIVFRDKFDRTIFIEIKKGILSRDAAGQIMEYYGLLKNEKPGTIIEVIVCANTIPPERREFLERAGIECREIGVHRIEEVARKCGYEFIKNGNILDPIPPVKEPSDSGGRSNSVVFKSFERWLSENLLEFRTFKTLGLGVEFSAKYDTKDGSITTKNSKQNINTLKHNAIVRIFERWKNAPGLNRYKASYYKLPPNKEEYLKGGYVKEYWPDPPDKIVTPAIPAIIKYWVENAL